MIVLKQKDVEHSDVNPERVRSALVYLDPHDRLTWVEAAFAVRDGLGDAGFDIWCEWGSAHQRPASEVKATWKSAKPRASGIGIGTLFFRAKALGWKDDSKYEKPSAEVIAKRKAAAAERAAQYAAEEAAEQAAAAERAQALWDAAAPADTHPYLERKGVQAHGLRVGNWEYTDAGTGEVYQIPNCLLIPMRDRTRKLWSLQCIEPDAKRDKRYLKGGAKRGNFFPIGGKPIEHEGRKVFVLGEGYATCASVHECTGHMVLVCFDASNLLAVAQQVRERDQNAIILFAADNDQWNRKPDGTPHNPGVEAATKAAKEVNGILAIPPFTSADAFGTDEKGNPIGPKDFNDWHGINGGQSLAEVIDATLQGVSLARVKQVVLVPSLDEAWGVAYALECLARLEGVPPSVFVVPYAGRGILQAVERVAVEHPDASSVVLAAPGDEAEAQAVGEQHGCRVELPPFGVGKWQGWGALYLDGLFDAIDGRVDADLRVEVDAVLARLAKEPTPAGARDLVARQVDGDAAGPEARLNENDVSQHAKTVAETIEFKLAKAFNIERDDPNYQKQVDALGIKIEVIERMIHGSFWSGAKGKLFFLNESQALNQYTAADAFKFLARVFGSPVDAKVIESATDAAAAHPGMSKGDAKELRKAVSDAVGGTILDHLKQWNQRESVEWRTDMFASEARMRLSEDKARIVLVHKPLDVSGSYEQEIIADYKQHFTRFDEFLEFLVMSRFALDRKKCYLWLLADSDWGKGFLLGVLNALGLAVGTSMREIEAMFEGKPVGRAPEEFKRAFALVVDEFKVVKSELKQLQSEINLSPKHQLSASVEVFAKLFMSAESVGSLVTSHGIEDQFANRMSIFQEAGSLVHRPLYVEVGNPRYFASVLAYAAETLNRLVTKMQEMGRVEAQTSAERWINGFIGRYGLDTLYERFSHSLPQVAADALPWLYKQNDYLVRDGSGLETRYYLTSANKVLDDYLNAHFDASEAPGYRKKKADMLKLMSADGRGLGTHWISGKATKAVLLMKAGSSAGDLAAEKQ
ncbi:PriCT-2 domain-containing protein [Bradyrhizobium sp. LA7.1]|uniref:PriCT-2 domain-containing protein n=1 Tax=Bradyrhizobium sp. LA7.1 TaxID=3156324 RepID=UPI003391A160